MAAKNRLADLPDEHDAASELLEQLARAHASESRVSDIVVEEVIRGAYRYCPALDWMVWDGARWAVREGGEETVREAVRQYIDRKEREARTAVAEAEQTLNAILAAVLTRLGKDEAEKITMVKKDHEIVDEHGTEDEASRYNRAFRDASEGRKQASMWLNMLGKSKIANIVALCRGMDGVLTLSTELDQHPDLLNCTNGVVDLATGALRPHDPDLLITKVAGGAYDPQSRCPQFEKALQAVHPEALEWFQLRMGQTFTGHTPDDDALVVSAGGGENGKTGVMIAMQRAAGDYGRLISHKVLISVPGQHTTELMDLRGLRFALLEETPEEGRLDTHQLKTTIGTPQITARHMRQNTITFDTTHTLWVNTNFMPQVDSTDHGTWRRLKAMPWPFKFLKEWETATEEHHRAGDRTLKPYLKDGDGVAEAALTWVVAGAVKWYQSGRVMPRDPQAVTESTSDWRAQSDVGFQFATENLAADPTSFITADDFSTEFNDFLRAAGKHAWSKQTINTRMPESLASAGIIVDRDPTAPTKVRAGDQRSDPPTGFTGTDTWGNPLPTPRKTPIEPGRQVRMWRGVRFRSPAEQGQPLQRAV